MAKFLDQMMSFGGKLLWLDDIEYSSGLLAGGEAPWLDVSACVAWRRKAQSLLKSGVVVLPVGRVCAAWVSRHGDVRAALGARSGTNFPLKTLLREAALRSHVVELVEGLRSSFPDLSLALVCPSPRAWVSEAYCHAFGDSAEVEVGSDEVDTAALHIADFLREFGRSDIDTILLEESMQSEPATAAELEWYGSVFNVATHYRWDVGLRIPGVRFGGGGDALAYLIAPRRLDAACFGKVIEPGFWKHAAVDPAPRAEFMFAQIPRDADPERVLDRLASLK
jgi:hypothetical protein